MNTRYSAVKDGAEVTCRECHATFFVAGVTQAQLDAWRAGELIQRAMPEVPKEIRELFISGTCPQCWEAMFRMFRGYGRGM